MRGEEALYHNNGYSMRPNLLTSLFQFLMTVAKENMSRDDFSLRFNSLKNTKHQLLSVLVSFLLA